MKCTKRLESLADNNNECVQNRNITTFRCSNKNLQRRDANGQHRKSFLFITPKISNRANTTIYAQSANSQSRKENCSKITKQTIRDLGFSRLKAGVFWPSGGDFSALRLAESQRLASLSGNRYQHNSEVFRSRLHKIQNRTDRYRRAYPTASQTLAYGKYFYKKLKDGFITEQAFFSPDSRLRIFDINWRLRHKTENTNTALNLRYNLDLLPPMVDLLSFNEDNFRWSDFLGLSEQSKANRLLRDRIVARFLSDIEGEISLIIDDELQLENGIHTEYAAENNERTRFGRLSQNLGKLRENSVPNQLHDLELTLEASHATQTKFYAKRGEKQPRQTSWLGQSREFFPYFWSSVFEGNCDDEATLCLNLASGHRQVPAIQSYPSDKLIDNASDQPNCYAASLYPKEEKLASTSLFAHSHALCLGKNRTAALVSQTEYCQKVPALPQGRRSCVTEDLPRCPECLR